LIILSIISAVLLIIGIVCLMKLTPEQVTDDIMSMLKPNDTLRDKARNLRGNKKKHSLYKKLIRMKTALAVTGKSKQFTLVCCASLVLFAGGAILSVLINNLFLLPVLSVALALLPFFYTTSTLSYYEKHTKEELETTLSIISTSYIRSDDILAAVSENIMYIRPPLREVFQAFVGDVTAISSNTKRALMNLREKVEDEIFYEWCDTLIQCQDDRTLKDTLQPVVAKLTDVRIVNSELKTMLSSVRSEYWMMVALVVGNIPLLYLLNKDWFNTLMFTTPGKVVLGICSTVILITALFMMKFTKPIAYKR
jgi:Flp pilus assembly protein TadB